MFFATAPFYAIRKTQAPQAFRDLWFSDVQRWFNSLPPAQRQKLKTEELEALQLSM